MVFGTGGKYVEVYNDSAIVSAYASDRDLEELILSTKMGEILKGTRGDKPVDLKKIIRILINCSRMMIEKKNISEFDFNPLLVNNENELFIVDVRINVE